MKRISNDRFERKTRWVPCANGIKLQLLRSVRFWTSLVRNCLNHPELSREILNEGAIEASFVNSVASLAIAENLCSGEKLQFRLSNAAIDQPTLAQS